MSVTDKTYIIGLISGGALVATGAMVRLRVKNQIISDMDSYLKLKDPVLRDEMVDFLQEKYSHLW